MGLPLFVAPVESDLLDKTASKAAATSPTRGGIRRHPRHDSRERRNGARRTAVRIYGPVQRNLPGTTQEHFLPWVEALSPPDHAPLNTSQPERRPFREALREMTRSDDWRRERLEERMTSLFGNGWQEMAQEASQRTGPGEERPDGELGWWSLEPRMRERRARVVAPVTSRFDRSPDGLRVYNRSPGPVTSRPEEAPPTSSALEQSRRVSYARLRTRHPRLANNRLNVRNGLSRRGPGVDGLGDRDRSLSPEVWDTLLTTLTPDPQPPSAGSSFASVVASQSAGASSNTPTTAPDLTEEPATDLQCESGCETSDMEVDDADYEHPDFARIRRRREEARQARARAADYNLDGPAEGPFARRIGSTGPDRSSRQAGGPDGPDGPDGLVDYRWSAGHDAAGESNEMFAAHPLQGPRVSWVAHLSPTVFGEGGDADDGEARLGQGHDGPGAPSQPAGLGEEDWVGMRRIVSSLARREDIPDEWWAEAGLSRTLPQHETN